MITFILATSLGATLRFFSEKQLNHRGDFHLGTVFANLVGSFILGAAIAQQWPTEIAAFCGAFTTFGGFIAQGVIDGNRMRGIVYVFLTTIASIIAAFVAYKVFS